MFIFTLKKVDNNKNIVYTYCMEISNKDESPLRLSPCFTLSDLRRYRGWSQNDASAILGITQARLSQIEHIGTQNIDMVERIAEKWGIDFSTARTANRRLL